MRRTRDRRGLSIRALSARASISTNTLLRIERGLPTQERVRRRLAEALNVTMDRLLLPDCVGEEQVTHSFGATQWMPYSDRRPAQAQLASGPYINDPRERRRLGEAGLVGAFVGVLRCALGSGQMVGSLLELYGRGDSPSRHPGEEFFHLLEGELKLHIGGTVATLRAGDTTTFWADVEHHYEPIGGRALGLCVVREC